MYKWQNINKRDMTEVYLQKLRKHCRKGENAGYQHFLLSHNVFKIDLSAIKGLIDT